MVLPKTVCCSSDIVEALLALGDVVLDPLHLAFVKLGIVGHNHFVFPAKNLFGRPVGQAATPTLNPYFPAHDPAIRPLMQISTDPCPPTDALLDRIRRMWREDN